MSYLEVLQTCPTWRNSLLFSLGTLDLSGPRVIMFDTVDVRSLLHYHMDLQIYVEFIRITIKCTVVNKCASTSVMSLYCWKSLISPQLSLSMTMLAALDVPSFQPHGFIPSL